MGQLTLELLHAVGVGRAVAHWNQALMEAAIGLGERTNVLDAGAAVVGGVQFELVEARQGVERYPWQYSQLLSVKGVVETGPARVVGVGREQGVLESQHPGFAITQTVFLEQVAIDQRDRIATGLAGIGEVVLAAGQGEEVFAIEQQIQITIAIDVATADRAVGQAVEIQAGISQDRRAVRKRAVEEEEIGFRYRQGAAIGGAAGAGAEADRGQIATAIAIGVEHMQITGVDAERPQFVGVDHVVVVGIAPDQRRDAPPATNGVWILQQHGQERIGLARAGAGAGVAGQQHRRRASGRLRQRLEAQFWIHSHPQGAGLSQAHAPGHPVAPAGGEPFQADAEIEVEARLAIAQQQ